MALLSSKTSEQLPTELQVIYSSSGNIIAGFFFYFFQKTIDTSIFYEKISAIKTAEQKHLRNYKKKKTLKK